MKRRSLFRLWFIPLALCIVVPLVSLNLSAQKTHASGEAVHVWLTTPDQQNLLTQQSDVSFASGTANSGQKVIHVNEGVKYQQIFGFGASMNSLSAGIISNGLSSAKQTELLQKLFDRTNGIGFNMLRQPIGPSDQDYSNYGTYDDNGGVADPNLTNFSIAADQQYIIPLLKQIYSINNSVKTVSTAWNLPYWMYRDGCGIHTNPDPQYYSAFANYYVKYIQAYAAQSPAVPPVWAVTPLNEPSCFQPGEENTFIRDYLAPAFANNGLSTNIIAGDQNHFSGDYGNYALGDSTTYNDILGTAQHHYDGLPEEMDLLQDSYPNKTQYLTEGSTFYPWYWDNNDPNNNRQNTFIENAVLFNISTMRNYAATEINWTIANGTGSQRLGGCSNCAELAQVDTSAGTYTLTPYYYAIGHTSKFVQRGAYRIDSNSFDTLTPQSNEWDNHTTATYGFQNDRNLMDTAYANPDGSKVLVVVNNQSNSDSFGVQWGNENFSYSLPADSVATFTWSGSENDTGVTLPVQGYEFNTDGNTEGWTSPQAATLSVSGGIMNVSYGNWDPTIRSASNLNLDTSVYRRLHIRIKNNTSATLAKFRWITSTDGNWDDYKTASFTLSTNDTDFHDYYINMGGNEKWDGVVQQIQLEPNYWQQLFGSSDIDFIRLEGGSGTAAASTPTPTPGATPTPTPPPAGTQLFYDDFESGNANQWTPSSGSWSVCRVGSNSLEYCAGNGSENDSFAGNTSWTNYSVQAYVVSDGAGGNQGIELLGRVQDSNHFYQAELKQGNQWTIYKNDGGSWTQIAAGSFSWSAGSYYFVKFTVSGNTLSFAYSPDFQGNSWTTFGSGTDNTWSSGKIGVRAWGTTGRFDQVRVLTV